MSTKTGKQKRLMNIPLTENDLILAESFFGNTGDHLQGYGPSHSRPPFPGQMPTNGQTELPLEPYRGVPAPHPAAPPEPAPAFKGNGVQAGANRVEPEQTRPRRRKPKPKPTHYKIVSFSMYNEDIERLEGLVSKLKARGVTKANKSQVVRYALAMVDVDKMPKSW